MADLPVENLGKRRAGGVEIHRKRRAVITWIARCFIRLWSLDRSLGDGPSGEVHTPACGKPCGRPVEEAWRRCARAMEVRRCRSGRRRNSPVRPRVPHRVVHGWTTRQDGLPCDAGRISTSSTGPCMNDWDSFRLVLPPVFMKRGRSPRRCSGPACPPSKKPIAILSHAEVAHQGSPCPVDLCPVSA